MNTPVKRSRCALRVTAPPRTSSSTSNVSFSSMDHRAACVATTVPNSSRKPCATGVTSRGSESATSNRARPGRTPGSKASTAVHATSCSTSKSSARCSKPKSLSKHGGSSTTRTGPTARSADYPHRSPCRMDHRTPTSTLMTAGPPNGVPSHHRRRPRLRPPHRTAPTPPRHQVRHRCRPRLEKRPHRRRRRTPRTHHHARHPHRRHRPPRRLGRLPRQPRHPRRRRRLDPGHCQPVQPGEGQDGRP